MDTILEYGDIIIIVLLGVTTLMVIRILLFNMGLMKHFSSRKFKVSSGVLMDPVKEEETFTLTIFNHNLNDARVIGCGFLYKNRTIDYFHHLITEHHLTKESKVMIASRDSIKVHIQIDPLLNIIQDFNKGKHRVSRLNVFVMDSLGLQTEAKAPAIRKVLKKMSIAKAQILKIETKEQKHLQRQERKIEQKQARAAKALKRKEKREKLLVWFKSKRKRQ